jgi:hypothetical protein
MTDINDAVAESGYGEEEQRALRSVLRKLGLSENGMTEEEMAEFSQPKITTTDDPMAWPNFSDKEAYIRAGLGFFDKEGVFRFTYQKYPDVRDLSAYLELRADNLVTWDGLPRNPARG